MRKRQSITKSGSFTKVQIDVVLIKEGDFFVAYCPSLELSSYGSDEQEAKTAFDEALDIFLDDTQKKGTLEKVLLKLGWSLRQMPKPSYVPPKRKPLTAAGFTAKKAMGRFRESVSLPL
ncbi:MAG: hypothetical protein SFU87_17665 [Chitinophagaceae bacterium]|jgi:predicted RNase H-like HicB family nuclease|nr:hypothetical protein [Chitinophagaceae bacterium]